MGMRAAMLLTGFVVCSCQGATESPGSSAAHDGGTSDDGGAANDGGAPNDGGNSSHSDAGDAGDAGKIGSGTLTWGGLEWLVRSGGGGPGPNTWDARNVSVDTSGNLHLQIVKRAGVWTTAELTCTQRFGFGRYQWFVEGAIDQLDPNVVLGLFTYPTSDVGPDGTNEIDVEMAHWGVLANNPLNYTVWPATAGTAQSAQTFPMSLSGTYTTHRFDWSTTNIAFGSYNGFQAGTDFPIATWTFAPASPTTAVPQSAVPPHLNLWLFQGMAPTNDTGVEIIIHDFQHP